jgi:hypothetical protein
MDYKPLILSHLSEKFPTHKFSWGPNWANFQFDTCPRFPLVVDDIPIDVFFNHELVQDLYHGLECSRLGIEPFHPDSLMIPFVPERMEPVVNELVALYTNAVRDHLTRA